ncbi:MAG TPA: OadG family protein [Bacillota bacterium]|nr:OadG family protein [Bacillota bacterium]
MGVIEGIWAAVFCMVVVFAVLICLYFLIKLFSAGIRKIEMNGKKSTE